MKITIRQLNGVSEEYNVQPTDKIIDLKQMIEANINVCAENQKLLHKGRALADDSSFESNHIAEGDTLHLVPNNSTENRPRRNSATSRPQTSQAPNSSSSSTSTQSNPHIRLHIATAHTPATNQPPQTVQTIVQSLNQVNTNLHNIEEIIQPSHRLIPLAISDIAGRTLEHIADTFTYAVQPLETLSSIVSIPSIPLKNNQFAEQMIDALRDLSEVTKNAADLLMDAFQINDNEVQDFFEYDSSSIQSPPRNPTSTNMAPAPTAGSQTNLTSSNPNNTPNFSNATTSTTIPMDTNNIQSIVTNVLAGIIPAIITTATIPIPPSATQPATQQQQSTQSPERTQPNSSTTSTDTNQSS